MTRILLTGVSGTGKSTLTRALAARGYHAVDLDTDEWSHWVDDPPGSGVPGTPVEPGRDWVWKEDRVATLLADPGDAVLVVSGSSPNQGGFRDLFDEVVLLFAPPSVIARRLAARPAGSYGSQPQEVARVMALIAEVEPLLRASATREVDTDAPLEDVIEAIARLLPDAADIKRRRAG